MGGNGINITAASSEAVVVAHRAVVDILTAGRSDVVTLMALEALSNATRVSVSGCNVSMGFKPQQESQVIET